MDALTNGAGKCIHISETQLHDLQNTDMNKLDFYFWTSTDLFVVFDL